MKNIYRDKLLKSVLLLLGMWICVFTCKGQGSCDNPPSKHPPLGFRKDTCVLVVSDIDYFYKGYKITKNQKCLDKADSLIEAYCDFCKEQQQLRYFIEYKFAICMLNQHYDEGIQFITEHPANEYEINQREREFYLTTLLSAKYLKDNDLLSYDSVNKSLQQKNERDIKAQSALASDTTLPVNKMAQKHFSELYTPGLDELIQHYYILRARTEDINAVLGELNQCAERINDNKGSDKFSYHFCHHSLEGLIHTIEEMSQKPHHFEYDLK